jgi:hypothetical protein
MTFDYIWRVLGFATPVRTGNQRVHSVNLRICDVATTVDKNFRLDVVVFAAVQIAAKGT